MGDTHGSARWASLICTASLAVGCTPSGTPDDAAAPVIAFLSPEVEGTQATYERFRAAWLSKAGGRCAKATVRAFQPTSAQPLGFLDAAKKAAALNPVLTVAPTVDTAQAARTATRAPVVFSAFLHPVRAGLVSTEMPRPEQVTGIALDDRLLGKRLDILKEAVPSIHTVGLLTDQDWRHDSALDEVLAAEQRRTGLEVRIFMAETPADVAAILNAGPARAVDAWYIPATEVGYLAEAQIIGFLRTTKKPAIHATLAEVRHGALMAYAQDTSFVFDSLAGLANRICNGQPAGSIPVERPRRFILSVRAEYDLGGLKVSPDVVARADQIE
jgi:putative tryptophan/tyrosine transport system substrate-binding protein